MDEKALGALDDVLARGFAGQHNGQGDFAFAHHLIQEVIYAGMTAPRRVFWHLRLAEAIQAMRPDDAESLAHHYNRAGDSNRARVYYAEAGDRARRFGALDDAARYYRAALERWPDSDLAGRAELLFKRGQCLWLLGELQAALGTWSESRDLHDTLGNRLRVGDIERMTGRVYWEMNDRKTSMEHHHRALTILEQEPESIELARAISAISQMHMLAAEFNEAVAAGKRALALAERLGAEDVAIHAQTNIGLSLASSSDTERALAMLRDSLHRALEANLPHDTMRIYIGLAEQFLSLGRYPEARETYDALAEYARRVHSDLFTGIALKSLVQIKWLTGHWSEALAYRQQLLDWMRISSRSHLATVWANRMLGTLHNDLGQPDIARRALERDLAAARSAAELQTTVPHLGELARAYAALGSEADAVEVVQELLDWVSHSSQVIFDCIMPVLVTCRWLATRIDSPNGDALQASVAWLQRAAEQLDTLEAWTALAEGSGMALLAEGNSDQSAEQLYLAAAGWESLGRPYDQALALGTLGSALQRAGSAEAACATLDQALAICGRLTAQLADAELRTSFLNSPQLRELRLARAAMRGRPDSDAPTRRAPH
jgi:tetratricopeptide (TPR) repeat protein